MPEPGILSIDATGDKAKKLEEARYILEVLDFPRAQLNARSALTLLALLDLKPETAWHDSQAPLLGVTPIMDWAMQHYVVHYAPNSRETFRRQTLHQFVAAALVVQNPDEPFRSVNSPKWCYQIAPQALKLLRTFGTDHWEQNLKTYKKEHRGLQSRYAMERAIPKIPVKIADGKEITLSSGKHSELIKAIIEEFAPRYVPGGKVIYVGDTGDKWGYFDEAALKGLGVEVDLHGKMPDAIIYYLEKNWLLLVEAVTSHGPVDGKRHDELAKLFANSKAGLIYLTAFPSRVKMKAYLAEVAWETEVWVADAPDHLIHFNGVRFLGPYPA